MLNPAPTMLDIQPGPGYYIFMATDKFLMTLSEEDRLLLRWTAKRTGLSMAECYRISLRKAITASGGLNEFNTKEFESEVQNQQIKQIENNFEAESLTIIASALDSNGNYPHLGCPTCSPKTTPK